MSFSVFVGEFVWKTLIDLQRSIEMKKTDEKKKQMPAGMMHGKKDAPKDKKTMPAHKGKKKGSY